MCTTGAVMEVHAARRRDRCPRNAELITVEEIAAGDFVTTSVLDFRPKLRAFAMVDRCSE
jgi:hypothetical protein